MGGQQQVLNSDNAFPMVDNGGGTYTYTHTVDRPGEITVNIIKYTQGGVYSEFYDNLDFIGVNAHTTISSDLAFDWDWGDVYPGEQDDLAAKFYFRFKPPVTGTYQFSIDVDDVGIMDFDGSHILYKWGNGFLTETHSLDANKFYYGEGTFLEASGPARYIIYWQYPGQPNVTIPSTAFYYPEYITSEMHFNVG